MEEQLRARIAELEQAYKTESEQLAQAQQIVQERTRRVLQIEGMINEARYWLEQVAGPEVSA